MATPEIYVVCLSSHDCDKDHGAWIDATQHWWYILADIEDMLKTSPNPNATLWAIRNYKGFYSAASVLGECTELCKISTAANLIVNYGELASKVICHFCGNVDEADKCLRDCYKGKFDSLADYAKRPWKDAAKYIAEDLARYIDYEAMGRDLQLGGDIFTITLDGSLHIFSNR
jgi:antirestriction protein